MCHPSERQPSIETSAFLYKSERVGLHFFHSTILRSLYSLSTIRQQRSKAPSRHKEQGLNSIRTQTEPCYFLPAIENCRKTYSDMFVVTSLELLCAEDLILMLHLTGSAGRHTHKNNYSCSLYPSKPPGQSDIARSYPTNPRLGMHHRS